MKFVKLNTKIYSYGFYRNLFHIFRVVLYFLRILELYMIF
jgi:hypothetical protein